MTDREAIADAVSRHYQIRNTADVEAVLGTLHSECTFHIAGTPRMGEFTRVADNGSAVRSAATQLIGAWDLSGLRSVDTYIDGDTALVHRAGSVRYIPTNHSFDTEMIDKLRFRDGLIVEYTQFVDTYEVARVAGMTVA